MNKKYIVPRFQREYSWTQDEISEIWKDIISNIRFKNNIIVNEEYFIGSLVLVGEDKSTEFQIVDGQQRLTTLTILLSALVETFKEIEKEDLAQGLYTLIEGKTVLNKPFFKLENEHPKPFLQKVIQNFEKVKIAPETQEEVLLNNAYDFFVKRFQKQNLIKDFSEYTNLDSILIDETIYTNFLEAIRDQILQLKTIYITVSNEDDAYTIFETLNARGMNLTTVDLVKNEIFKALRSQHPNDDAKDNWKKIRTNLSLREEKVNIDTYFRHFWLSKYEFTTEDKIYKSFKKLVKQNKIQMDQFLEDLIYESDNYKKVTDPLLTDWKQQEEREIFNSLMALNVFRVTQVRTLLIALLTQRNKNEITLTDLKRVLKIVENFHFIFSAVCSSRASGLESKYSKYARRFRECKNNRDTRKVILDLNVDLKEKLPAQNTFVENFGNLYFTNDETKHKRLIQYIFKTLESSLRKTDELEIANITLEHIIPQSTVMLSGAVGKIGNLLPLAGSINNLVDRKDFKTKMVLFEKSELRVVKEFIKENSTKDNWTEEDILQRTEKMAIMAYNNIWRAD
ncbi:hypothetical protein HMPREF0322_01889 [Desulfitobacterium hafniense DP7]|uniref:DUF262 domain-containing protein n=2 Tax=Desulfitobacterium hafniense TaxID=49338 RepID=G9XLQ3_DESHA|nr:hypothetical protein HMPREF0322_01889 [Desulfitobacterium hafniense DP7]